MNDFSSINGILLLNKSSGITSNRALQKAKKLVGAQKAGHTGSLDPLATGMLPLCFGEATKVSHFLLNADKCYETTGLLGIKTNTGDSEGEIISQVSNFIVSENDLNNILETYKGCIQQVPSMFSALKHKGQPLYRYARKGVDILRKEREISIKELQLNSFNGIEFSLFIVCSKGTYIRNLVEDIGDSLQVGAHVIKLHRLYTCGFENMPMFSLEELEAMSLKERIACLIPMDKPISYLDEIHLVDEEVVAIRQGKLISDLSQGNSLNVLSISTNVRLYDKNKKFIGIGELNLKGELKAKRLLSFTL